MDEVTVERVLRAVECVPAGRVVAYGDIARLVGIGPRQVGSIMREWGGTVTWWRVTSSYGDLGRALLERARTRWAAEGILVKPNGLGCRIADYRADLEQLARDYEQVTVDLPKPPDQDGEASGPGQFLSGTGVGRPGCSPPRASR